jgi:hypothetical protein
VYPIFSITRGVSVVAAAPRIQHGPLLLLELAAEVAANALRARYVAIEGDFLARRDRRGHHGARPSSECDELVETLDDYCRRILARLRRECSEWPL